MRSYTGKSLPEAPAQSRTPSVLITGCNGFVGVPLARAFLRNGWAVKGSVRFPHQGRSLPEQVTPVAVGDIGPRTDWVEALQGVEVVVHLAAKVHQGHSAEFASEYQATNASGTERLALSAAAADVRRLVFLSTLKVCGPERPEPCRDDMPEEPVGDYAVSKRQAEIGLREVAVRTGLETVILRPPIVYGPGVKANFLRLIHLVVRGVPLPFGGIGNKRSMIYLGNLVDGILMCVCHGKAAGNTFAIADEEAPSTPELVRLIAANLGVTPRLFRCPVALLKLCAKVAMREADMVRLTGSFWTESSKIKHETGWRPKYTLSEGLHDTIAWYRGARSYQPQ